MGPERGGTDLSRIVIDTYAKVAFAKLYDRKTQITAAAILNDRVAPFNDEKATMDHPGEVRVHADHPRTGA